MTSASAPLSLVSHDDKSPAAACCHRPRKRRRTSASKASSRRYQRSGPASRQNARIPAGVTAASTIGSPYAPLGRGLLLVAQFAAQDLADIGLGQFGPELDLLGDLVGGELRAAILDDFLGREVLILLDDERLHRLTRFRIRNPDHGAFQHARM